LGILAVLVASYKRLGQTQRRSLLGPAFARLIKPPPPTKGDGERKPVSSAVPPAVAVAKVKKAAKAPAAVSEQIKEDGDAKLQQSEAIFYPQMSATMEGLSEDAVLYELFLRQISEMNARPEMSSGGSAVSAAEAALAKQQHGSWEENALMASLGANKRLGQLIGTKKLVEEPVELEKDSPIEMVYKKRVVFGNFVSRKGPSSSALVVRLTTGEQVTIDASQIVSVWDTLADDETPSTPAGWASVAAEALTILGNMSPRKSDLQEFWQIISQRSNAVPVDSLDLGIYIFQERKFRSWVNPYAAAGDAGVRALTSSQRYAAALLLFHDDFHFKRRPSVVVSLEDVLNQRSLQEKEDREAGASSARSVGELEDIMAAEGNNEIEDDEDKEEESDKMSNKESVYIYEGAYKCLDEGLALFKEGEVFAKYYQERASLAKSGEEAPRSTSSVPFRAGCITRQLRSLEMYAMSPTGMAPPLSVKHLLKRMRKPMTPFGAKEVLKEMNMDARRIAFPTSSTSTSSLFSSSSNGSSSSSSSSAAAAAGGGGGKVGFNSVTPWPPEVLQAAEVLSQEISARRTVLSGTFSGRSGKKGPSGRMDFRSSNVEHPVICIDGSKATFLDDAFSLSPETGEILVHVVDVAGSLRRYELLQETAKERVASAFLPSGPIHMLPAQALDALKLSSTGCNEVLTVALSIDSSSGALIGFRIFPALIGPVFSVDIDTADEIIESVASGDKDGWSFRLGYPDSVVRDLVQAQNLIEKVIAKQPWTDLHFSTGQQRRFSLNKRTGTYRQAMVDITPGNRMLNTLLTLYSNSSVRFCEEKGVNIPVAWENRDRVDTSLVRRFATQPLRNWLAQLQQKQLRAALKLELPLTRKDCAMAVAHHNDRRKQMAGIQQSGRDIMSFESLEAHCATVLASGQGQVVLNAEGLGRGGSVRLVDFKVIGTVMANVEKGKSIRVQVKKIVPETRTVSLELVD